jgi:hypothetical protein
VKVNPDPKCRLQGKEFGNELVPNIVTKIVPIEEFDMHHAAGVIETIKERLSLFEFSLDVALCRYLRIARLLLMVQ